MTERERGSREVGVFAKQVEMVKGGDGTETVCRVKTNAKSGDALSAQEGIKLPIVEPLTHTPP